MSTFVLTLYSIIIILDDMILYPEFHQKYSPDLNSAAPKRAVVVLILYI